MRTTVKTTVLSVTLHNILNASAKMSSVREKIFSETAGEKSCARYRAGFCQDSKLLLFLCKSC